MTDVKVALLNEGRNEEEEEEAKNGGKPYHNQMKNCWRRTETRE